MQHSRETFLNRLNLLLRRPPRSQPVHYSHRHLRFHPTPSERVRSSKSSFDQHVETFSRQRTTTHDEQYSFLTHHDAEKSEKNGKVEARRNVSHLHAVLALLGHRIVFLDFVSSTSRSKVGHTRHGRTSQQRSTSIGQCQTYRFDVQNNGSSQFSVGYLNACR